MVGRGEIQKVTRLCEEVLPQKDDVAIPHDLTGSQELLRLDGIGIYPELVEGLAATTNN
jgi:hypothetical protein